MIDAALHEALTADAAVAADIGTRAYPQNAAPHSDYPLVSYMQIAAGVEETRKLDGPVSHFRTLWQIDIYARTRAAAIALADKVRAALDGKINEEWGGFTILAAIFDDQRDGTFEADANLHRIIQQYRISWQA